MSAIHSEQTVSDGIHIAHALEFADAAARTSYFATAADVGKIARQLDTGKYYILEDDSPLTWGLLAPSGSSGEANTASNVGTGANIFKQKTVVDLEFRGISAASSKITAAVNGDNIDIDVAEANLNLANQSGTLANDSAHGTRGGGTQHAAATTSVNGFMSAADKTKLDASGELNTSIATQNVTKATATIGVATVAARADHKHDVSTGVPSAIGSANAEGSATTLSRSDHVHNHGNQAGGSLHAAATGGSAGFMSATDKTKLDGLPSSFVFGNNFQQSESLGVDTTSSTTPQVKTSITTPSLPSGTYRIAFSCVFANNYNSGGIVQLYDSTAASVLSQSEPELRGFDHPQGESGFAYVAFSGVKTFELRYSNKNSNSVEISYGRLEFWRVA